MATNRDLYVATQTFLTTVDGVRVRVSAGMTFARSGHEILTRHPQWFKRVEPQFETTSKSRSRFPADAEILTPMADVEVED